MHRNLKWKLESTGTSYSQFFSRYFQCFISVHKISVRICCSAFILQHLSTATVVLIEIIYLIYFQSNLVQRITLISAQTVGKEVTQKFELIKGIKYRHWASQVLRNPFG